MYKEKHLKIRKEKLILASFQKHCIHKLGEQILMKPSLEQILLKD